MILKPFSISKNSGIVLTYQSGASAVGELYLMRKISDRTYAELAQVVYEQIQKGNVIKLDFQWVQSADFISVLTDCTDIGIGDPVIDIQNTFIQSVIIRFQLEIRNILNEMFIIIFH